MLLLRRSRHHVFFAQWLIEVAAADQRGRHLSDAGSGTNQKISADSLAFTTATQGANVKIGRDRLKLHTRPKGQIERIEVNLDVAGFVGVCQASDGARSSRNNDDSILLIIVFANRDHRSFHGRIDLRLEPGAQSAISTV